MARVELSSDFRALLDAAESQEWTIQHTASQHYRFVPKDKSQPAVVFSGSPGDHRAIRNFTARLRRSGLQVRRK